MLLLFDFLLLYCGYRPWVLGELTNFGGRVLSAFVVLVVLCFLFGCATNTHTRARAGRRTRTRAHTEHRDALTNTHTRAHAFSFAELAATAPFAQARADRAARGHEVGRREARERVRRRRRRHLWRRRCRRP